MSDVAERLASPSRRLSLAGLAASWFQATVSARVPGHGVLAHDLRLLRRVRGSVGDVLLEGASREAIAGQPCPWRPPCALDLLFREQGRQGGQGIPKPYVIAALRKGRDVVVTVTLFGFAADWAGVVAHALTAALQHRIDWGAIRPALFLPRLSLAQVAIAGKDGLPLPPPRGTAELQFLTPMNGEGNDPLDRPSTILKRLARRIEGLARWQDAAIDWDWPALAAAWEAADYNTGSLRRDASQRRSRSTAKSFTVDTLRGALALADLAPDLWPLLVIGEQTHVGKGASEGFGRFILG